MYMNRTLTKQIQTIGTSICSFGCRRPTLIWPTEPTLCWQIYVLVASNQWRRQALKSGWAQCAHPDFRARNRRSGGRSCQKPILQKYADSLQLSKVFLRRLVAESVLYLPSAPSKNFWSVRIPCKGVGTAGALAPARGARPRNGETAGRNAKVSFRPPIIWYFAAGKCMSRAARAGVNDSQV